MTTMVATQEMHTGATPGTHAAAPPGGVTTTTSGTTYAGAVSRLAAYVVDNAAVAVLYSVGAAVFVFLAHVVAGAELDLRSSVPAELALGVWWLTYFSMSWATTGATLGMALLGVRVVRPGGAPVGPGRALVRALAFPLSVALFGLGFVGILVGRDRRALHDLVAGTAVVYDQRILARVSPSAGDVPAPVRGNPRTSHAHVRGTTKGKSQ